MRKTSVCILTLALMFGVAALSLAADTKAPAAKDQGTTATSGGSATTSTTTETTTTTKKATTKKAKSHQGSGSVVSKDDTAKSFVVHPKKGEDWTFMTTDKTSYWKGKEKSSWADLAAGDNVTVTYTVDGTNKVAKSVKIKAAPAAKKPA